MNIRLVVLVFSLLILRCSALGMKASAGEKDGCKVVHVGERKEFTGELFDTTQVRGEIKGAVSVHLEHDRIDGSMHRMRMRICNSLNYPVVVMYKEDRMDEAYISKTDVLSVNSSTDVGVSFFSNQESLFDDPESPAQKSVGMVYISKIKVVPNVSDICDSVHLAELVKSPEKYLDRYITVKGWLRFDNRSLGLCEDETSELTRESGYLRVEQKGLPHCPAEFRVYASVTGLYSSDFGLVDVKSGSVLSHLTSVTLYPNRGVGAARLGPNIKQSPAEP